ncbi:MAG TPA: hypothetical protein VJ417_17245, partial [Candidatus Glassbacteria bacterium]|nr:hypothetical protein [Candidatus Glassbacteria bacterium]
ADIYGGITSYSISTDLKRVFVAGRLSAGQEYIYNFESEPLILENQVWHIGFDTGMKVCMWPNDLEKVGNGLIKEIFIDLNFGYLMGGDIKYFDQDSIQPERGLFAPEESLSFTHEIIAAKTNMFKLHLALEFEF